MFGIATEERVRDQMVFLLIFFRSVGNLQKVTCCVLSMTSILGPTD